MGHNKTRKGRVARLIRMGKKLKRLRENFNLTQQQVAEALGIDRSTYAYYELGRTTPDLDKIDKLQRLYQVQYQDLIEYDEEENRMQLRDSGSDSSPLKKNLYLKTNPKNSDFFYQLNNDEQRLILNFRLLSKSNQENAIQHLLTLRQQQNTDKEKRRIRVLLFYYCYPPVSRNKIEPLTLKEFKRSLISLQRIVK